MDCIISFIIGLVTGFFANLIYDWYKIKSKGKKPYVNVCLTGDLININGQIANSQSNQESLVQLLGDINCN